MIRRILTFPDPILAQPALPVENLDGRLTALLDDLAETMYAAPGIGLAATQVGVAERAIVLDVPAEEGKPGTGLLKLVNPVIAERDGTITWEEGCLSVPDFTANVERARRILLRGWTAQQTEIEIEAEGLLAVALQHELDHLDGKLFVDRVKDTRTLCTWTDFERYHQAGFVERAKALVARFGS
jgi:peptide deformylase